MSIKVYGILVLSDSALRLEKQIEISFLAVEFATKNKIGIKLGGNVHRECLGNFQNVLNKLPFELTDDPMDVNAQCLFAGDGIEIQVAGLRIDSGESLFNRMSRVQGFFKELLKCNGIDRIILDVNIEDGDEFETVEIHVNDFSTKIIQLYEQEGNWTPTVRIVIT